MEKSDLLKSKTKGKFLVAVCAFIINNNGEILMTKRSGQRDHDPGAWELISGRFNQDFSNVEDEITREIKEELGENINIQLIAPISFYHFYRANDRNSELVGINYLCRYLGGKIKLSSEHTEYSWIEFNEAVKKAKHELLIKDLKHFTKIKDLYLDNDSQLTKVFKKSN